MLARGIDGLEGAKKDVEASGGKALALPTDVADSEQVENAAIAVEEAFGPIDIWVNDAMASILSPFMEMNLDDFRRATEVTYLGYVYGTMAAQSRHSAARQRHIRANGKRSRNREGARYSI